MLTYEEKLEKRTRGCVGCLGALILVPIAVYFFIYILGTLLGIYGSIDNNSFVLLKEDIYAVSELAISQHESELFDAEYCSIEYTLPEEYKHLSYTGKINIHAYTLEHESGCTVKFPVRSSIGETEYYIYHYTPVDNWQYRTSEDEGYKSYFLDEHVEHKQYSY